MGKGFPGSKKPISEPGKSRPICKLVPRPGFFQEPTGKAILSVSWIFFLPSFRRYQPRLRRTQQAAGGEARSLPREPENTGTYLARFQTA